MRSVKRNVLGLALALAAAGCANHPLQIASSNRPVLKEMTVGTTVAEGESCQYLLFGFIPLTGGNTMRDALDLAKSKSGSATLVDITADYRFTFLYILNWGCTTVRGYPAK